MAKYKRSEIEDRAQDYLDRYPGWSNRQINAMLRLEYDNAYLTDRTFTKLRRQAKPYFHTIIVAGNEVDILKKEGFLVSEVRELLKGLQISLDHEVMVDYRKSRLKWWADRLHAGWRVGQIWRALRRFYQDTEASPWDDFRAEYMPSPRKKSLAAYRTAMAKRKKARKIPKPMYHLLKTKPKVRA